MLTFILLVIAFFVIRTIFSHQEDKKTLKETPIQDKFRVIIRKIDEEAFDSGGMITKIDWQSFMLGRIGSNQLVTFIYAHKVFRIEWKYKYYQKEMKYTRSFTNADNWSIFEQEKIAKTIIYEFNQSLNRHKSEVNKTVQPKVNRTVQPEVNRTAQITEIKQSDVIEYIESEMMKDLKQHIKNRNELNISIDSLGLMMSLAGSKERLEALLKNKLSILNVDVEEVLSTAFTKVVNTVFESKEEEEIEEVEEEIEDEIEEVEEEIEDNFNLLEDNVKSKYTLDTLFIAIIKKLVDSYQIKLIAGTAPNLLNLPIEEAKKLGLIPNKTYLIHCKELDSSISGKRVFNFEPVKELTEEDIENMKKSPVIGPTRFVDVR